MVNYSKWDNLDSGDSDSDDGPPPRTEAQRRQLQAQGQQQQRNGGDDKRSLVQAELLRVRGNTAFERGELATAVGAYEAQLQVLDGCKDDEAVEMVWGALLNQASALIRLKNFREVEVRCSKLLAMPSAGGGAGDGGRSAAARGRAFHFRGFSRLRRGMHEEACSDFRSALSTGTSGVEEARALLAEAEAGLALSSCPDPEAKGKELLRRGEGREAAEHFRDAASRARLLEDVGQGGAPKGQGGGTGGQRAAGGGSVDAGVARARLSRMQAVGSAMAGDGSSAEMLLRGGLQELRAGPGGGAMSSEKQEEEGLTQAALGSLLAQERNHAEAVVLLRAAIVALDGVIADVPTGGKEQSSDGSSSIESSLSTAADISPTSPPPSKTARKGLTRTLTATLAFLGTSLLALDRQPNTSTNATSANEGTASAADGGGGGGGSARPGPEGERSTVAGGSGGVQGPAVLAESPAAAAAAAVVAAAPASIGDLYEEAVDVLKRALGMLRIEAASLAAAEAAASASAVGSAPESTSVASRDGGVDRRKEDVAAETARVLDALSEAYARARRWEQARSAAELSLTAWRSLGDAGRAGASTSLLSIGHLVLELHGVGGGIEEASARWEEAARCFNGCARPSDEAEVRVKIAGFYSKVARSDPSRLESLSEKIAAHYSAAAGFFALEREEAISSLERAAAAVTIAEESSSSAAGDQRPRPPPSTDGSLGSGGLSPWELAEKEASAWEGFAGAVGDDHEEAARALRKAEGLLNVASVSEKDDSWRLKKIEVLSSLALAVARCGEHKMAEDKLLVAIAEFQQLDGVSAIAGGGAHQDVLVNLLKYLAVARRARGDIPGAREALAKVEALGGSESREHVQDLNRLLSTNSFPLA